ncbi:hypothetical protein [Anaerobacillus alkaliphilus]|uniref:hypothetical protein n=1 Tax=Anaerobacillus alkaliphilus TaxID=1548597 RepID=UPI001375ABD8|nr:hypothetical protein [Anaerobacillus alkaliphilus]
MEDIMNYGEGKSFSKRNKQREEISLKELFKNPIIHKEIHGDKVYTPLDPSRLWGI